MCVCVRAFHQHFLTFPKKISHIDFTSVQAFNYKSIFEKFDFFAFFLCIRAFLAGWKKKTLFSRTECPWRYFHLGSTGICSWLLFSNKDMRFILFVCLWTGLMCFVGQTSHQSFFLRHKVWAFWWDLCEGRKTTTTTPLLGIHWDFVLIL